MLLLCVFTATAQKTAVIFVFASFPMWLNTNGIGKNHVLKLQSVLRKATFLKQVRCRTNFKLRLFSVQKVVLFPKYALNFASIFFKLSLSGNFLVVKPLF